MSIREYRVRYGVGKTNSAGKPAKTSAVLVNLKINGRMREESVEQHVIAHTKSVLASQVDLRRQQISIRGYTLLSIDGQKIHA